jgi:hypothetical protein
MALVVQLDQSPLGIQLVLEMERDWVRMIGMIEAEDSMTDFGSSPAPVEF